MIVRYEKPQLSKFRLSVRKNNNNNKYERSRMNEVKVTSEYPKQQHVHPTIESIHHPAKKSVKSIY